MLVIDDEGIESLISELLKGVADSQAGLFVYLTCDIPWTHTSSSINSDIIS